MIRAIDERDDDTGELLWWSNTKGWVELPYADVFTPDDRKAGFFLPIGGQWVQFESGHFE